MAKPEHEPLIIHLGLLWAFAVTVTRAIRWPNDWAEAHWLVSYEFGFLKRALPGTLSAPIVQSNLPGGNAEFWIRILASIVFLAFCSGIFRICLRIIKNCRFDMYSLPVVLLFLTSPYIAMSANLIGYYDGITMMITISACMLVLHGKFRPAAVIMSLAMLIHEAFLFIGFPSVIFLAFTKFTKESKFRNAGKLLGGFLIHAFPLLFFPALAFSCIVVNQTFFLDSAPVKNRLLAHLSRFEFIQLNRNDLVSSALTSSFFAYAKDESPKFLYRITRPVYVIHTTLPLMIFLIYGWHMLRDVHWKRLIRGALAAVTLLPLSFHAVACDTGRIWTYPLVTAMLGIYALSEIFPDSKVPKSSSLLFCIGAIIVVVFQVFIRTPLPDGECERFTNELRTLLYAPPLLVTAVFLSRRYRLSKG